jgi:maleate isomerase
VGSYLLGTTGEQELVSRVEQHSNGIPVLMSAPAAAAGFLALEAERIALVHAPFFTDDFDQKGAAYFQEHGFEVVHPCAIRCAKAQVRLTGRHSGTP